MASVSDAGERAPSATDVVVVGAGVIGLALAHRLAHAGREVVVLEREARIGMHTSSRNSEVLHAGLYYPAGSLKARLCVRGRELLYAFCAERGIGHARCGKLVVASEPAQLGALRALAARAAQNGVSDLRLLDANECRALELALRACAALHSPSTGIIDSHALLATLDREARARGAIVALQAPFRAALPSARGFRVEYGGREGGAIDCSILINAAGLFAPDVARCISGLEARHVPVLHYAKGHYFTLQGRAPFARLIYPLPDAHGLGIHVTLDLTGGVRFGPDVCWIDMPDYTFEVAIHGPTSEAQRGGPEQASARRRIFAESIRRYYPDLDEDRLAPGFTGVRPKLSAASGAAQDFLVQGPAQHGIPRLVNLFGIESPGLTASLALAEHVCALLAS
jgi:L-2-hydroxyglutarate oxidase LhgO